MKVGLKHIEVLLIFMCIFYFIVKFLTGTAEDG